jgi:DNA-directed RNA polymerase subunit M/transcription elongation factor TFIIS
MASRKVTFCPKCKARFEARDFFSSGGQSDWRVEGPGVNATCQKCGYRGPAAEASVEDYRKLAGK